MQHSFLKTLISNDELIASNRNSRLIVSLIVTILCTLCVSMFMYQEILRDQYPYDVDGWGHLVNTLASNNLRQCEFSVFDAYNPDRGFLLPYIFALSYCVFGFVESVQVFNVLFHAMSCFIVVFFISNKVNSLILTSSSVLLWSVWPAYSYLHGYYFSEQIGALLILVVAVLMLKSDKSLKYFALTGLILALLLHVRSSSVLLVLAVFFYMFIVHKGELKKGLSALLVFFFFYSTLPLINFIEFNKFIPFTTQGGFALHEGTYLPGDDLPAGALRKIPEFNERESKIAEMNAYERDKYWKGLALQNISEDSLGQVKLIVKKAMRFWAYVPGYSWQPTWKSLIFALPLFVLWLLSLGLIRREEIKVFTLLILTTWAMHALIHSEYRYSYVVFPMIIMSAGIFAKNLLRLYFLNHSK